jgi:predicted anti-sigma-YlaC factor YlaD
MPKIQFDTTSGCIVWRKQLPKVLSGEEDDPIQREWVQHTENCPECRDILLAETELVHRIAALSKPAPALVAASVMSQVRRRHSRLNLLKPREVLWGLASSAAGVFIGIWLSSSNPVIQTIDQSDSGYEAIALEVDDGLNQVLLDVIPVASDFMDAECSSHRCDCNAR